MPPLTRSHSAEWEILHFLAAGPAKRRDLFQCYYMKERHPKASLLALLTHVISFQRWRKTSEPQGLQFRPHNCRSFSQFMPADRILYCIIYSRWEKCSHLDKGQEEKKKNPCKLVFSLHHARSWRIRADETGLILREEWEFGSHRIADATPFPLFQLWMGKHTQDSLPNNEDLCHHLLTLRSLENNCSLFIL